MESISESVRELKKQDFLAIFEMLVAGGCDPSTMLGEDWRGIKNSEELVALFIKSKAKQ